MKIKIMFLAACMLFAGFGVTAAESAASQAEKKISGWSENYEQALKAAAESKRPILINFTGSDWCGWCVKLDKEVFSTEDFKKYAGEKLVLLKIDVPRNRQLSQELMKQNRELAQKFGIRGFPTILLLNAKGEAIGRTGYRRGGAVKYTEHLDEIISAAK